MNRNSNNRKVAAEVLSSVATLLAHDVHTTYRVAHVYKDGLTSKEYDFLMARHKAIELEMKKTQWLVERLRKYG